MENTDKFIMEYGVKYTSLHGLGEIISVQETLDAAIKKREILKKKGVKAEDIYIIVRQVGEWRNLL